MKKNIFIIFIIFFFLLPIPIDEKIFMLPKGQYDYKYKNKSLTLNNRFYFINKFYNEKTIIKKKENYYLIDKTNKILKRYNFDYMSGFNGETVIIGKFNNNLLIKGFANITGEIIIVPQFNNAKSFSEGLAAIKKNDKWGFINKKGEIIINPQFDFVESFSNNLAGFANINYNHKFIEYGYINKFGKIIIKKNSSILFSSATIKNDKESIFTRLKKLFFYLFKNNQHIEEEYIKRIKSNY